MSLVSPSGLQFVPFHKVFGKKWSRSKLAPLRGWCPLKAILDPRYGSANGSCLCNYIVESVNNLEALLFRFGSLL